MHFLESLKRIMGQSQFHTKKSTCCLTRQEKEEKGREGGGERFVFGDRG